MNIVDRKKVDKIKAIISSLPEKKQKEFTALLDCLLADAHFFGAMSAIMKVTKPA